MTVRGITAKATHGISDGEKYWVVTNGIKKKKTPAFKTKASNEERWQMSHYVKRLMGDHAHTSKSLQPKA